MDMTDMEVGEFRENLIGRAKWILIPDSSGNYRGKRRLDRMGVEYAEMPYTGEYYDGVPGNGHHLRFSYAWNVMLPKLSDILGFGYDMDDFLMRELKVGGNDFSYVVPKDEYMFRYRMIDCGEEWKIAGYDGGICYGNRDFSRVDAYHSAFIGQHGCCEVENLGGGNGRTLLVSCDSQMIPEIPVLCHYYGKVIAMDNRSGYVKERKSYDSENTKGFLWRILDSKIDDVVMCVYNSNVGKYTDVNLK